jgi:hypothetical protein
MKKYIKIMCTICFVLLFIHLDMFSLNINVGVKHTNMCCMTFCNT